MVTHNKSHELYQVMSHPTRGRTRGAWNAAALVMWVLADLGDGCMGKSLRRHDVPWGTLHVPYLDKKVFLGPHWGAFGLCRSGEPRGGASCRAVCMSDQLINVQLTLSTLSHIYSSSILYILLTSTYYYAKESRDWTEVMIGRFRRDFAASPAPATPGQCRRQVRQFPTALDDLRHPVAGVDYLSR